MRTDIVVCIRVVRTIWSGVAAARDQTDRDRSKVWRRTGDWNTGVAGGHFFTGRKVHFTRTIGSGARHFYTAIRARAVAFDTLFELLSDREFEVLALAARGYTNKAISAQLYISDRTVQGHLAHIYAKLQTNTRTEAVMRAVSLGLIAP